jgi:hypothetical protein
VLKSLPLFINLPKRRPTAPTIPNTLSKGKAKKATKIADRIGNSLAKAVILPNIPSASNTFFILVNVLSKKSPIPVKKFLIFTANAFCSSSS